MANIGRSIATMVCAGVSLVAPGLADAGGPLRPLEVRIHNQAGVDGEALRQGLGDTVRIFADIGVSLTWTHEAEPTSTSLRMEVVLVPMFGESGVLGDSRLDAWVLGVALEGTNRVYVFCGRIAALASKSGTRFETILGRVLAHEIGHQLLPGRGHSQHGLMRATLDFRGRSVPRFADPDVIAIHLRLAFDRDHAGAE